MAGLTLRDILLRGRDSILPPPREVPDPPEADADSDPVDDEESFGDHVEEEEPEGCGKAGRPGMCGGCADCADWGDMKYHEKVDRELERRG